MTKRFILLTAPKSGSNYFGSQITKIPEVIFLNSLFSRGYLSTHFNMHNRGINSKAGVLSGFIELLMSDEKIMKELLRFRTDHPVEWLFSIMNMDLGGFLGVKIHPFLDIWYQENFEIKFSLDPNKIINTLAPSFNWTIITMLRRNIYEQLASSLISIHTQYFNTSENVPELIKTGCISNNNINQHIKILLVYKKCYNWLYKLQEQNINMHIWYDDLIIGNVNNDILTYFNVKSLPYVKPNKLINRPYEDMFEDYDYFKKVINDL